MAKEKTSQPPRLSLMPWGHCYFFCREVISLAMSLLLLPWGFFLSWVFSLCREVFSFAVRFFLLPWIFSFWPSGSSFCRLFSPRSYFIVVTILSHRSSQVLLLIRWADIWHAFVPNITREVGSLAWKIDFTVWQTNIYHVWGNTMSTTDLLYLCMLLGSIPFGHLVKLSGSPSRKQFLSTVAGVCLSLALVGVWGILHSFWTILGTYVIVISLGPR